MSLTKDTILYDRLGVAFNASTDEITKAGRKMSMKWHPDKHPNNKEEASEKFKEIREAIDILSDSQKRSHYDQVGLDGIQGKNMDDPPRGFPFPFPGMPGMGMPFGFPTRPANPAPEPIVHHLRTTLEQIAKEELIYFNYQKHVKCTKCDGEGTPDRSKITDCKLCKGSGMCSRVVQSGPVMQHMVSPCETCDRTGKVILNDHKCNKCSGKGYIQTTTNANIRMQKTIEDGMKLRMDGQGHQTKHGTSDLFVIVHIDPHEAFDRYGCHLTTEIELTLYEALFGFTKIVYHLDGRNINIQWKGKTDYGTYRKMIGEGFVDTRTGKTGNLYIQFTFSLPEIDDVTQIVEDDKKIEHDEHEYGTLSDLDADDREHLPPSSPKSSVNDHTHPQNPQECRTM